MRGEDHKGQMNTKISIGIQSFEKIREAHSFYIDKTCFIKEWWESKDDVTLITRPRRFGKTLNMSMLECFFSSQYSKRADLFEGLSIWKEEAYQNIQGTYPVIFMSLAGVKAGDLQGAKDGMIKAVANVYDTHSYLKDSQVLSKEEKANFDAFQDYSVNPSPRKEIASSTVAASLQTLSGYLERFYRKKVLIFLDEYDTPIQEAFVSGYWKDFAEFMRPFFNLSFKENKKLERGILTGITRVSKESIFSDLNNLEVITTTSKKYCGAFGFTEGEVRASLDRFHMADSLDKVRYWYDGFRFGDEKDIYNPWSITKYLDAGRFGTYWANTSSNHLVSKLIREGDSDLKVAAEDLLSGRAIRTVIDEEIVFDQLGDSNEAVWSLLLASGYLRVERVFESDDESGMCYDLALTNLEVKKEFHRMIQTWFKKPSARYNDFVKAMMADHVGYMNQYMNQMASAVFSFFDTGKHPSDEAEPERFYHGFVLGLMADAKLDYVITSNRESGLGRYDVVMEPRNKGDFAYVLEFKVKDPHSEKTLEDTVKSALDQIRGRDYDRVLTERGIPGERIRHYGFAFEGKRILIG